jgi:hypothetical protein
MMRANYKQYETKILTASIPPYFRPMTLSLGIKNRRQPLECGGAPILLANSQVLERQRRVMFIEHIAQ